MTEEKRKTKVPVFRINNLLRLKRELDEEVKSVMEKYGVDIGYIRGLFKQPSGAPPSKKTRKSSPKKKSFDRSDLIE